MTVEDAAAHVTLASGETLEADLIVGADGAHSWVRAQIGSKATRRDYRQTGVVANFKAEKPHGETAYQWFRDTEIIALLPLPGDHVSLVWSARTDHADALLALDPAQLAAEVETATQNMLGALECVTPAQGFPLALQTVDRLIAPRVALVGDAAHLIHPLAGQGMNLGLRDVAALADVLANKEAFRDLGDPVLLRRYERARREDIQKLDRRHRRPAKTLFRAGHVRARGAQHGHGARRRAAARQALAGLGGARLITRRAWLTKPRAFQESQEFA